MFYYINGKVVTMDGNLAVVDVSGVGYGIHTTSTSQADLTIGELGKLYIYNVIREDCFDLYGFSTLGEKRCFEMLIGVSGVGPKAALSILSSSTPESLAMSILAEDEKTIMVAQGIGKKIAQRVILELKDKMAKSAPAFASGGGAVAVSPQSGSVGLGSEAAAALAVLGYSPAEISYALRNVDVDSLSVEEVIRQALKSMAQ